MALNFNLSGYRLTGLSNWFSWGDYADFISPFLLFSVIDISPYCLSSSLSFWTSSVPFSWKALIKTNIYLGLAFDNEGIGGIKSRQPKDDVAPAVCLNKPAHLSHLQIESCIFEGLLHVTSVEKA